MFAWLRRIIAGGTVNYVLAPVQKMVQRAAKERERLSTKIKKLEDKNTEARKQITALQNRINERNEQQEALWRQQRKLDDIVGTLEDAFDL